MSRDPIVTHLPLTKSQFLQILREYPHFLESLDIELILKLHSHKIGDVLSKTRDDGLLRALCESSIVRMRQIYCEEVKVWKEREVLATFDNSKANTWIKSCKTRYLKSARRARATLELHRDFKKFKKI